MFFTVYACSHSANLDGIIIVTSMHNQLNEAYWAKHQQATIGWKLDIFIIIVDLELLNQSSVLVVKSGATWYIFQIQA